MLRCLCMIIHGTPERFLFCLCRVLHVFPGLHPVPNSPSKFMQPALSAEEITLYSGSAVGGDPAGLALPEEYQPQGQNQADLDPAYICRHFITGKDSAEEPETGSRTPNREGCRSKCPYEPDSVLGRPASDKAHKDTAGRAHSCAFASDVQLLFLKTGFLPSACRHSRQMVPFYAEAGKAFRSSPRRMLLRFRSDPPCCILE